MNNNDIPVWEKYTLPLKKRQNISVSGENKLRALGRGKQGRWLAHYEWQPHTD